MLIFKGIQTMDISMKPLKCPILAETPEQALAEGKKLYPLIALQLCVEPRNHA